MKVFWSWQSDTPGRTGRHFVRRVLAEAIDILKETPDIEEPRERDEREGIHLDHDRQGISGTPDLAATILKKIEQTFVFVADVTLVGEHNRNSDDGGKPARKTINPNVAIEYGFALKAVGDTRILLVQNTYYGDRDQLPLDLIHKAGPIQFRLSEDADQSTLTAEAKRLRAVLVEALRLCLSNGSPDRGKPMFQGQEHTTKRAYFWHTGEPLASLESPIAQQCGRHDETIKYYFDHPHVFYLRCIPAVKRDVPFVTLQKIVQKREVAVLTRQRFGGIPSRNRFGAIIYENSGTTGNLTAATQLFESGEIWGVTAQMAGRAGGTLHVYTGNVENIMKAGISSYLEVATNELRIPYPFQMELGGVGLKGLRLALPHRGRFESSLSDEVFRDELYIRKVLSGGSASVIDPLVDEFLTALYDNAGFEYKSERGFYSP